ncbi:polyphosphate glucokinase ppgK [Klebsormidium nitens]|uniref:Polyphosphate glucokinase ppgK n=1 Tax=Klebsormidium nitens TaxID=105231 RepID=A0A1Y1HXZ7_KLENI|nr:polyphosphate glucokinase ppgK [Klebsormidium nitens]|eukprot:GAQ80718.1 polyphosphate glucokinase ppgK [Klebsormidium nitens]
MCGIAGTSKWGDRTSIDLKNVVPLQGDVFLGVDFGGTGVKAAPVDITTGELQAERHRIPTPQPATPEAIAGVIKQLAEHFEFKGVIGVGVPSVVRRGVVYTAANIDKTWVNINAQKLFEEATGCPVVVLNDADAAGLAEMNFGEGRGHEEEVVLVTTFGTGIGTALYVEGKLVPNLELGHIEMDGEVAEKLASSAAREREDMSWKKWAGRVSQYLGKLERLLSPDLIIMGGGVSKKDEKFSHYLELPMGTPVVMAAMRNEAGIVGAALGAHYKYARFLAEAEADAGRPSPVNGVALASVSGSSVRTSP